MAGKEPIKVKVASLIMDYDLYPRGALDTKLGNDYAAALSAGAIFPPIIVCADTRKVVDGFKRCRAHVICFGKDAEILAIMKKYRSDADRVYEAIMAAATQGERLTASDYVRCANLAKKFNLSLEKTAEALQMKLDRFVDLVEERSAKSRASGDMVPLKWGVAEQWKGKTLTARQEEVNKKLVGMRPLYFVNRLMDLMETDGIDTSNEKLMDGLMELSKAIRKFLARK